MATRRYSTCNGDDSGGVAFSRTRRVRDEAGAVIVLALIFLIVVGGVVGTLATWATNDLNNTAKFTTARSLQYDVTSAVDFAIQNIRYTPLWSTTLNASPPAPCWGSASPSELATSEGTAGGGSTSENVEVWCSTQWNPSSTATRVVTFSACPLPTSTTVISATTCAGAPYLQAVIAFDDYPPSASAPTTAQCVVYCGSNMTVNSWDWSPTLPTVSGVVLTSSPLSPVQGSITGGTGVTISGSGFVSGSTVNFVEESNGTPASDNVIIPATGVSFVSSTSITANSPVVVEGTTYFVTVTTPGGTSAYIPYPSVADVFTYTPVVPYGVSVTTGGTGSISGATEVTIGGHGFVNGSTVNFVPEDTSVTGATTLPASSVTVVNGNTITTFSPVGAVEPNYYITVTTPAGTSATGGAVFTYTPLTPVVGNLTYTEPSPSTGGYFTITGIGFLSDATVTLVAEKNGVPGASYAATGITVTGYTTVEADAPAVPTGNGATTTFYVIVTTTWGGTSYSSSTPSPIFSYT